MARFPSKKTQTWRVKMAQLPKTQSWSLGQGEIEGGPLEVRIADARKSWLHVAKLGSHSTCAPNFRFGVVKPFNIGISQARSCFADLRFDRNEVQKCCWNCGKTLTIEVVFQEITPFDPLLINKSNHPHGPCVWGFHFTISIFKDKSFHIGRKGSAGHWREKCATDVSYINFVRSSL